MIVVVIWQLDCVIVVVVIQPRAMTRRADTFSLLEGDERLADVLLDRISTEETLTPPQVCQEMGLSWGAFLAWCNADTDRMRKIKDVLEVRSHLLGEGSVAIADAVRDKDDVPAAKLQVDTRFRLARAYNAKVFGEKQEVQVSGSVSLMAVLSSLPRGSEVEGEVVELERLPPPVDTGIPAMSDVSPSKISPQVPSKSETPEEHRI